MRGVNVSQSLLQGFLQVQRAVADVLPRCTPEAKRHCCPCWCRWWNKLTSHSDGAVGTWMLHGGPGRTGEDWGWRRHRVSTLATQELRSEPPHSIILVMAVCVLGGCCFQIRSAGWKIKIQIRSGSRKNKKPIYGLNKPSTNSPWRGTRTVCFLFVLFFQSFSIWSIVEVL